ncbi:MAG: hypothetical protein OEV22_08575, partial [Deltaproteobacteria bacterium]|nr:hypothetical protein [Deltaproteobacteria bacterium]
MERRGDAENRRRGELIVKQWTIKEPSALLTAHRLLLTCSILDTLGIFPYLLFCSVNDFSIMGISGSRSVAS